MKRIFCCLLIVLMCSCIVAFALAEDFDVSQYSYEELKQIRDLVDAQILEMDRQYAIEHGDRIISFEKNSELVYLKKTITLTPEILRVIDSAPETTNLIWTSSDPAIATVNNKGIITGVALGEAVITVTAEDNEYIFGSCGIQVIDTVSKIVPDQTSCSVLLSNNPDDAKATLSYSIQPETAYYKNVTWTSSDENIVSVDQSGCAVGHAPGTATITMTSEEPVAKGAQVKKATVKVTVVQAVIDFELDNSELTIAKGKKAKLSAIIAPENATNKTISYSSDKPDIATVAKDGTITAKAVGTATITCETADGTELKKTCKVTVIQGVSGIKLSENKIILGKDKTKKVSATISPSDATNKNIIWTSSNEKVATVEPATINKGNPNSIKTLSPSATIKAISGGDAIITATSEDGSKSATINVHVPTFNIQNTTITVTSKSGTKIPIEKTSSSIKISVSGGSSCFSYDVRSDGIFINPIRAGSGSLTVKNPDAAQDKFVVKVIIDHKAVYDTYSYPHIQYEGAARYPSAWKGDNCSFSGRVLQVITGGSSTSYRISSKGRYDNVVYVTIKNSNIDIPVLEDDNVTVYGTYDGNYTYKTIMGAQVTIPSVKAEKIIVK